ncbi:20356_t:CDS:2 [Cetraspora pellucida]|uniref:20356_t:CDS:1 n=1 Tax=Cetraspora pellucida TaxID=1433469 RepID=A0A9N9HSY3_9GLOM|nr:20356_t:CDS:2 [Cetraspora pellucida]
MESEEENIYLDENYIIENNISEIIDDDILDNINNISENETNISQENEENNIETDDKPNFRSTVHQHFKNNFFQTIIKRLNNIVKIPSADTISNKIVKLYNNKQLNLQKKLQEIPSKILYTLDIWTSKNQKSFIRITAYWISED